MDARMKEFIDSVKMKNPEKTNFFRQLPRLLKLFGIITYKIPVI